MHIFRKYILSPSQCSLCGATSYYNNKIHKLMLYYLKTWNAFFYYRGHFLYSPLKLKIFRTNVTNVSPEACCTGNMHVTGPFTNNCISCKLVHKQACPVLVTKQSLTFFGETGYSLHILLGNGWDVKSVLWQKTTLEADQFVKINRHLPTETH